MRVRVCLSVCLSMSVSVVAMTIFIIREETLEYIILSYCSQSVVCVYVCVCVCVCMHVCVCVRTFIILTPAYLPVRVTNNCVLYYFTFNLNKLQCNA